MLITLTISIPTPRPIQQPHPPLWQTVSGPDSCEAAGKLGVGMLASACLAPLEHVSRSLELYDRGLAACEEPVEGLPDREVDRPPSPGEPDRGGVEPDRQILERIAEGDRPRRPGRPAFGDDRPGRVDRNGEERESHCEQGTIEG